MEPYQLGCEIRKPPWLHQWPGQKLCLFKLSLIGIAARCKPWSQRLHALYHISANTKDAHKERGQRHRR